MISRKKCVKRIKKELTEVSCPWVQPQGVPLVGQDEVAAVEKAASEVQPFAFWLKRQNVLLRAS